MPILKARNRAASAMTGAAPPVAATGAGRVPRRAIAGVDHAARIVTGAEAGVRAREAGGESREVRGASGTIVDFASSDRRSPGSHGHRW